MTQAATTESAAVLDYAPVEPPEAKQRSVKELIIRGSLWTTAGEVTSRAIRLGSNLVLTRLLAPEMFGLMNIVTVINQGLATFSEVGILPSIVQNRRGDDPAFLNTAWTIQVIRGFMLCFASCLLAWPVARFYTEPQLLPLLMVSGTTALVAGFASTSLATLNRHLALGKRTLLDQSSYFVSVAVMMAWAWHWPSVWALVGGGIAGAIVKTTLSHFLVSGVRVRFQWEPAAVTELFRFGRWIFISTVLSFIAARGDRLIVSKLLPLATFGKYSIALALATLVQDFLGHLSQKVLFPAYSKLSKGDGAGLQHRVTKVRLTLMAVTLPPTCAMILFGPQLIRLMYDDRYLDAGWMLQILAVGGIMSSITSGTLPILLASGDSFRHTVTVAGRAAALIGGMALGGWLWGPVGLIAGAAAADFINYPVVAWAIRKYGVWMPGLDLAGLATVAAVIGTGFWLMA